MRRLDLIKDSKLFQGQKNFNLPYNYFEGWYFKNSCKSGNISFIPGINVKNNKKQAFIQVLTNTTSYFLKYDFKEFKFCNNPFYIKIGNNKFSDTELIIDIDDASQNLRITGNLKYSNNKTIYTNKLCPGIMGPFAYIHFMQCNHSIISMKNNISGNLNINDHKLNFNSRNTDILKKTGAPLFLNLIYGIKQIISLIKILLFSFLLQM